MNDEHIVKLQDVVTVVNNNEYDPISNGIQKYVAGGHIISENLFVKDFGDVVNDREIIGSAFHKLFKKGQILYKTRYPNSGAIATFDGLCSNTTLVLETKKDGFLIEGLLPFILHWDGFNEHLIRKSVGSTNNYVRWRDLAEFEFLLPSKNIQLEYHKIFWSIQNIIDDLENLIQKTTNYLISSTQFLLTHGIKHTKFKKISWFFGRKITIPEKWEIMKLSDLSSKITDMNHSMPAKISEGIPFLTTGYVSKNQGAKLSINYSDIDIEFISKIDFEKESKKFNVQKGDILFTRYGTLGIALFVNTNEKFLASYSIALIKPKNLIDGLFLTYFLNSNIVQQQIEFLRDQSTNNNLHLSKISEIKIILPSKIEQEKIVAFLSKIDENLHHQKLHLNNLRNLRRSIINSKLKSKEKINVAN